METQISLAIVILNWNGRSQLNKYLPDTIKFSDIPNVQIIVADNGSTDDSVQFVRSNFPKVKIIELDKNYGFAEGYNKALEQIDAEYFCLLNSDAKPAQGWLEPVLKCFESNPDIAAVQPKILSDRDHSRFEHAGACGGFIDKYGYPFCRGRIMDIVENDHGQYDTPIEIFWASGAALFIRSSIFRENKGLDGDYFAHMEEIDLCWRMKNQGYKIVCLPQSVVYHWGGATLDYNNPRKLFLNFRNSLWTLYKNYMGKDLNWHIFKRMCIDTIAIAKYILTFDFKNAAAIISAHRAFYKSKDELKKKRKNLLEKIDQNKPVEQLPRSIVLNFFIKRKKRFSQLGISEQNTLNLYLS